MKFLKILFTIIYLSLAVPVQAQVNGKNSGTLQHFDKMAEYLSRGSGKWRGENKHYNSTNPGSPKAYGLWFERPLKYLLTIKIVAYLSDTVRISSQGIFFWHPQKNTFVHVSTDMGNGLSEGISEFPNDSTFISTMIIYRPNGKVFAHKDQNFIVSENVHRNTSYKKNAEGQWMVSGNWIWIRDP